MISKGRESIEIPQICKPILAIKEIFFHNQPNKSGNHFIIATLDKKVMLISIKHTSQELKYSHDIKQTQYAATELFFDSKTRLLFLGCHNGNIIKMNIDAENQLNKEDFEYIQPNPSSASAIMLLYTRNENLIAWDINNMVRMVEIKTMALMRTFKVHSNVTAGITFNNPFTHKNVGCVGLSRGCPPLIFDCDVDDQIKQIISASNSIYKTQQIIQYEITLIANSIEITQQEIFLACGSTDSHNIHCITIYNILFDSRLQLTYLEPVYRFLVGSHILNLSMNHGILVICMYNKLNFFNVAERDSQLMIEKKDLEVTEGFVLQRTKDSIKFLVNKGYHFLYPNKQKQKILKLRIRQKNLKNIV